MANELILNVNFLHSLKSNEGGDRGVCEFLAAFESSSVAAAVDKQLTPERFFSYVLFKAECQ